jgi:type III secretory pathway lipoprotein EscJ
MDTCKLKKEESKVIFHSSGNHMKATLIKNRLQVKKQKRQAGHYTMIKVSVQHEDITVIYIHPTSEHINTESNY